MTSLFLHIMRPAFFAARYGITEEKLVWALVHAVNEDGEAVVSATVWFREADLFVNFNTDTLLAPFNMCGCSTILEEASVSVTEAGYLFTSGHYSDILTASFIEEKYGMAFTGMLKSL